LAKLFSGWSSCWLHHKILKGIDDFHARISNELSSSMTNYLIFSKKKQKLVVICHNWVVDFFCELQLQILSTTVIIVEGLFLTNVHKNYGCPILGFGLGLSQGLVLKTWPDLACRFEGLCFLLCPSLKYREKNKYRTYPCTSR
jgi:hypothetical protein